MPISIHRELRHRGQPLIAYPGADLWGSVGGSDGVAALIQDLYRRIAQDALLREVFPHFSSKAATPFFVQWFGGSRAYSDDLAGGLLRRHQHRYINAKAAAAWLRCMREALVFRGLDAEQVMRPLELLVARGANPDACVDVRGTPLMYFARHGKAVAVQWLLAHGADRNARNKSGKTAAETGRSHAGIVRLLTK